MRHLSFFLPLVVLLFSPLASPGSTVVIVDITDLSAVTITAVPANADDDSSSTTTIDGATLWNFFSSGVVLSDAISGTFGPESLPGEYYDSVASDSFPDSGGSNDDLNLFKSTGDALTQTFSMANPPFMGQGFLDLSSIDLSAIPVYGHTGLIYSGYSGTPGTEIGSYIVVPEPSTLILGAFAGTLLLFRSRRSRSLRCS